MLARLKLTKFEDNSKHGPRLVERGGYHISIRPPPIYVMLRHFPSSLVFFQQILILLFEVEVESFFHTPSGPV